MEWSLFLANKKKATEREYLLENAGEECGTERKSLERKRSR